MKKTITALTRPPSLKSGRARKGRAIKITFPKVSTPKVKTSAKSTFRIAPPPTPKLKKSRSTVLQ